jgi:ubiquinone/menaquinone biosynthesis C-methylase UbiE
MQACEYSPGYSDAVLGFMGQRTAETHAAFFLSRLQAGWRVLDAGCGPGAITLGLARAVRPGSVVGVDIEDSQFARARRQAEEERLNLEFRKASVYELPFDDHSFDAVFSHALFTHLGDPAAALIELRRVLKPGGVIGLRASDLGGMLIDAASEAPVEMITAYMTREKNSQKDPNIGRKLGRLLRQTGFIVERQSASYEVISDTILKAGPALIQAFMKQAYIVPGEASDTSLFVALAWCEAIAVAP